ncbi:MAG: glycosyltransferase [Candidatus Diapherotrites archaeon]
MNAPKVSIIIPMHNSSATIRKCLESIFLQESGGFEVIAVDDASSDNTAKIAKNFPCLVFSLGKNSGQAKARNFGAAGAKGNILVFIDSDIVLEKNSLKNIVEGIEKKGFDAVGGIVSGNFESRGIVSFYKNAHHHYFLLEIDARARIISGFFMAIKKSVFLGAKGFNESFREAEDIEFSQRLQSLGAKILFDKKIRVNHIQRYSLPPLLRGDFMKGFYWARLLPKTGFSAVLKEKRFTNRPLGLLLGILFSLCFFLSAIALLLLGNQALAFPALLSLFLFVWADAGFFAFVAGRKGFLFLFPVIALRLLDLFAIGLGAMAGFFRGFFSA